MPASSQSGKGVQIRAREPGDMRACVQLLGEVHRSDAYPLLWPEHPDRWLTPATLIEAWVAEDAGEIAGHIALCSAAGESAVLEWEVATRVPAERMGVIAKFFVAPRAQRQGIGAALLQTATDTARARRFTPVLEVLAHNGSAIALYERTGWRCVGSGPAPWAEGRVEKPVLWYFVNS